MSLEETRAEIQKTLAREALEAGVCVVDVHTGDRIDIAVDRPFPSASVFKVPLMVEVYRQAEAGRLDLDSRMPLEERHKTLSAGVLQRLAPGLAPTLRDLVTLSIIISDNTATEMLVERIGGADGFNAGLRDLGMDGTHYAFGAHGMFLSGFGLPDDALLSVLQMAAITRPWSYDAVAFERGPGNTVSTAGDLAGLIVRMAQGQVASPAGSLEMLGVMAYQQHLDRIARGLPWGRVCCKTGSLGGVRNDVGLIQLGWNRLLAYAVLTFDPTPLPGGNSDTLIERNARVNAVFGDIGRLLWRGFGGGPEKV